jgi:TonB family protein
MNRKIVFVVSLILISKVYAQNTTLGYGGKEQPQITAESAASVKKNGSDKTYYTYRQVDTHPMALVAIRPKFPKKANKHKISGEVNLRLLIDETGNVNDLAIANANPEGYFEQAALDAFRNSRWAPAQKDGHAVKSTVVIRVKFSQSMEEKKSPADIPALDASTMPKRLSDTKSRPEVDRTQTQNTELISRNLEFARLEAQIQHDHEAYQARPKCLIIDSYTKETQLAQYVENWRQKVEAIGNRNYPEEARKNKLYGGVHLTTSIKPDGTVEKVEIDSSSGSNILDAAAVRIIQMASPYEPFPESIRTHVDILGITRIFNFMPSEQLQSE